MGGCAAAAIVLLQGFTKHTSAKNVGIREINKPQRARSPTRVSSISEFSFVYVRSEFRKGDFSRVGDSVFVDDGVCSAVVWDEESIAAARVSDALSAGALGVAAGSWAWLNRGSMHTRTTRTAVLIENSVNKAPPKNSFPVAIETMTIPLVRPETSHNRRSRHFQRSWTTTRSSRFQFHSSLGRTSCRHIM
jgi:hypothetical protein